MINEEGVRGDQWGGCMLTNGESVRGDQWGGCKR